MNFVSLNFLRFLIFGGVTAWLGKRVGVLTLAAFSCSAYNEASELLVLTPMLAFLNVTSLFAQWTVVVVITANSFFANR